MDLEIAFPEIQAENEPSKTVAHKSEFDCIISIPPCLGEASSHDAIANSKKMPRIQNTKIFTNMPVRIAEITLKVRPISVYT